MAKAKKRAKRGKQPEAAKLGVAKAPLEWQQETDADGQPAKRWRAQRPDGVTYTVEEDERDWRADPPDTSRAWFCEVDGEYLGDPQPTLEAGQALCQWHADTELVWVLGDRVWTADTTERHIDPDDGDDLGPVVYAIEPEKGGELFYCQLYTDPVQTIGDDPATSLEDAQERCQDHYREQHPPPQAESTEATPKPAATPGQLPPPQRADWVIPMPLTDEEMIEAFEEGRKLRRKRRRLQAEVAASAEKHKKLAARNKELIDKLEDEIEALDEHMPEKPVDCFRSFVRDGDEIWVQYTAIGRELTGLLHEHKLTPGEQRQLFGEGDPPADKPPPPAPEPPVDDPPPATEPHPEPEADPGPAEQVWFERGSTISRCQRYSLVKERGLWQPCYGPAAATGGALPGTAPCANKAQAVRECQHHLDTRLRFPGDVASGLLLDSTGRYQLVKTMAAMGAGVGEGPRWRAEHIGGQDEQNTDLGEHDELAEAIAACQADADRRRAEASD